jgi:group I intron endonuclease
VSSGIYIIHNTKNGMIYIGQTKNMSVRWGDHKTTLKHNTHVNRHLQSAWNKYGADAFEFKILEYCDVDQLDAREQHFLNTYMKKGVCYNIRSKVATASHQPTKRRHDGIFQMYFRGDKELKERVKAAAEAEGMLMQDWLRAVIDYGMEHPDPLFFLKGDNS